MRATLVLAAALSGSVGCTLISSVDRDSIPSEGETTDGGSAGGDGATTDVQPDQGKDAQPDGDAAPDAPNDGDAGTDATDANDEQDLDGGDESIVEAGDEQTDLDGGDEQSDLDGGDEQSDLDGGDEQTDLDGGDEQSDLDGGDQDASPDATDEQTPEGGADGTTCTGDTDCTSGFCVGGVCCATACPDQGAASCGTNGVCTGGTCQTYDTTTVCAAAGCANGAVQGGRFASATLTGARTCDGTGTCTADSGAACSGNFVCADATTCKTSCANDADCVAGTYCDGSNQCVPLLANGDACAADGQCQSHVCAAGDPSQCEECATDVDCTGPASSTCDGNHQCQACTTAAECANGGWGSACSSGVCTCADDSECTNGRAPSCFDDGTNQRCGCGTGAACAAGELCTGADDSDTCKVAPGFGCTADADCASGSCQNGACTKLDDGKPCAHDAECTSNTCGGGVCKATPQCATPADCPAPPNECVKATCDNGQCGTSFVANDTPVAQQTVGNCTVDVCDGNGNIKTVNDDADLPPDLGIPCQAPMCDQGTPGMKPQPATTSCSDNGGTMCDGNGNCVQCLQASDCGADTACRTFACDAGTCAANDVAAGALVADPTTGDCRSDQCDGNGNIVVDAPDGLDLPVDGNECTEDVCTAGTPSNPPLTAGATCSQNGGTMCDGSGLCVECVQDSDCPAGGACQEPKCNAGVCGFGAAGAQTLPAAQQTAGDCQELRCDGTSQTPVSSELDTDVPDDGNDCTDDVCTSGTPDHSFVASGMACDQGQGVCDGAGACMGAPDVTSATPQDGSIVLVSQAKISLTFNQAMDPTTLTVQSSDGACTGSLQVSDDEFASCLAIFEAAPVMSAGDTVASFSLATTRPNTTYKIRLTTEAKSALGVPVAQELTMPNGFTTAPDVVISQVYGGGGNTSAAYTNDFVVLHNRAATTAKLAGLSLQYTSKAGTTWGNNTLSLTGTIPAGEYFLVQLASGGSVGAALPTADQSGSINLSSTDGKLALAIGVTGLPGDKCPDATRAIDFVGYGAADCAEGTAAAALSNTTAAVRNNGGCDDTNVNSADFTVTAPAPKSSADKAVTCN